MSAWATLVEGIRSARTADLPFAAEGRPIVEFTDVVRRRRMVRAYRPSRPVPHEVVEELLDLATHAPSAGFTQGWRFLVLQAQEQRDAFWTATDPGGVPDPWLAGMRTAPVLIVAFADKQAYLDRYAEADKG
jgi:nitroreductase